MGAFQFKQFKIEQERSAMKVNTDGVLLGAWMSVFPTDLNMLDVGTGSGVIALMAAQRVAQILESGKSSTARGLENEDRRACITAIDIEKGSCEDAAANFLNSPWGANSLENAEKPRIELNAMMCSFQDMAKGLDGNGIVGKYDLIFSNPPYFINSLKSPDAVRSNSRHTDTLSQGELIKCAMEMLRPQGRLALVLPATEAELLLEKTNFICRHTKNGENVLHLGRLCKVRTTASKSAKRYLMEFFFTSADAVVDVEESELIMQKDGSYTNEYSSLVKEFYLNF